MTDQYNRLVQLIDEQAGQNFRSAFYYDQDDWAALYIRDDLATADLENVVPALAERARGHEPLVRKQDYEGLGEPHASVSLHENAVLIHFHETSNAGVVITLDTDVARNLSDFVERCERVLEQ